MERGETESRVCIKQFRRNLTLISLPCPGTVHTADFRNGVSLLQLELRFAQKFTLGEQRGSFPLAHSSLGQIGVHSVHTRRTLSQSQAMHSGNFIPDEYTLSSPWVNTNWPVSPRVNTISVRDL
jgi:hypothetical protein